MFAEAWACMTSSCVCTKKPEEPSMAFPLESAEPASLGLNPEKLARLCERIERHVAEGGHPGAQVAVARHGKLALSRSFGRARVGPPAMQADDHSFAFLSNTRHSNEFHDARMEVLSNLVHAAILD
jgi:CubicO group peptidase (beta-lactamase class C family)